MQAAPLPYAEFAITSNFSFLRGASRPEELALRAHTLGLQGFGIADRNSVAGLVRAHSIAHEKGLKFAPGARLVFADATPDILAYPRHHDGWRALSRLLTRGKRRAGKGKCDLYLADLLEGGMGLNLILCPPPILPEKFLSDIIGTIKIHALPLWLAACTYYGGDDARRLNRLAALSQKTTIPLIAINDVFYHHPDRRPLQDVLTCIREHVTIDGAGRLLSLNAERHLKSAAEMARLFRKWPEALEETLKFSQECRFSLSEIKPDYPQEEQEGFSSSQEALVAFAYQGAAKRYPEGVPEKIRQALAHELGLIGQLGYAPYFLTVYNIVKFARGEEILCQGRGSAANSTVCFCLGITEVDPLRSDLLFERFISAERNEPPDIDIDFEHERREEVIQHVYETYGREHAALTATTICYRGRSAIREVGKAFGLSEDSVGTLARTLWGWSSRAVGEEEARGSGLNPSEPRLKRVLELTRELIGFPRHLSQHVGGFIISQSRLDETVPIENAAMQERTVIEWNKDDLEALGLLKVDLLGLGMLSCIRRAFHLLRTHYGLNYTIASLPAEERPIYDMLGRADSIGVFQVESRAQMSMLPRLKPQEFYDLVIEVAIVRPGPIQGNMVHPYLRRRQGLERIRYAAPSPAYGPVDELEKVLKKTLGVPLFQEQAMRIAIVAAGFAPAEADRLRRAMATFRRVGTITTFREKFINNMCARGYPRDFAQDCFRQIEGFGEYGFPESHAASFALLVYVSAWLKCHYPDVFACALLNSQPMGFYAPAQILRDAQEHGIGLQAADINFSGWDYCLEKQPFSSEQLQTRHQVMKADIRSRYALRLGFRQIGGFSEEDARIIEAQRGAGYPSIRDLWLRTGLSSSALRRLAQADAFQSLGLSRRKALWAIRALRRSPDKDDLPLFTRTFLPDQEKPVMLPSMTAAQNVIEDYRHLHLSLKGHPLAFLREQLKAQRIIAADSLYHLPSGEDVLVAGLVLVRQRPGNGKTVFMTLEDETGIANVIIWQKIFRLFRPIVMGARLVTVKGRLQNESGVVHVLADTLQDFSHLLHDLVSRQEKKSPLPPFTVMSTTAVLPKGRNFH
jgi:error-prone DNA polymerase